MKKYTSINSVRLIYQSTDNLRNGNSCNKVKKKKL